MKKVLDWLDDRTAYRAVVTSALEEDVPGGASFAYVFGSVLTFILVLQMTTGMFLAMYYSPSATDAWASVAYIQDSVTMGWFIRGLHSYGASAMVIVAGLHLLQTAVYGAYKKPREINWLVGVLMLGLILAFALTGYLLPWDQTGYWATKVATGIAGTSPVIGQDLQSLAQGGNEYGNLTLTRFFAIHVFILPGVLIGLVVIHVALFRKHGVTPKWGRDKEDLEKATEPFWPNQMFKDMVAMAVTFSIMVVVNISTHGAKLDGPADPASNFDARPEWYFRALFQVLKYFEGTMEHVVALGAPVVVGGVLLGLPFVDRGPDRSPKARIKFLAVLGIGALAVAALTAISFQEDRADEQVQASLAKSHQQAKQARALAKKYGVPTAGGPAVYDVVPKQPWERGRTLWEDNCESCHEGKEREAPMIVGGYNSRAWIRDFLTYPNAKRFFGLVEDIDGMEPVRLDKDDMDALVEWVYAKTGAEDAKQDLVKRGAELFDGDGECSGCHESDIYGASEGPNLGQRGTLDYLAEFIAAPGRSYYFGDSNEMPAFGRDELSEAERYDLAAYLIWLRTQPTPPLAPDEPPPPPEAEEEDGDEDEAGSGDGEGDGEGQGGAGDGEDDGAGEAKAPGANGAAE